MLQNKLENSVINVLPETKPVYIISDLPEKASVNFGFDAYAKTLAELIANKYNETPLVIGVYGPWGSGKTTLMEAVKQMLDGKSFAGKEGFRPCKTVWFQAWKYDKEDEILAGLIEAIFKNIKSDSSMIKRFQGYTEEAIARLNVTKGVGELLKNFLGVDVNAFFSDSAYRTRLGFYDTFQDFFTRLVWTYTRLRPQFDSSEDPDDTKGALVVFIDDLDRCPQPRVVKVLETIKLFMDHPGSVFVIGADEGIIRKALREEKGYEPGDARKFMEKIVQVTFPLPHLSENDFKADEFLEKLDADTVEQLKPHLNTIARTTRRNIRRFKRFINDLSLMAGIHRNKNTGIDFDNLLRWKIIIFEAPDIQNETTEAVCLLKTRVEEFAEQGEKSDEWTISGEKITKIPETHFRAYLENQTILNLFKQLTLNNEQIRQLITLSESIKRAGDELEQEKQAIIRNIIGIGKSELDAMVEVPSGVFLYGNEKNKVTIEEPFEIDVFSVTNSQFARFIKEGGYALKNDLWTKEGREFIKKEKITQPLFWDNEIWNQPDYPVVGVSWYEANAYAKWAGKRLPIEIEWERAARGTNGWIYPWGNEFDKEKCNTKESGIGKTTRVTHFPNGISPVGCYDMAGNVWEWTRTNYKTEKAQDDFKMVGYPVLRGGSWGLNREDARCASRLYDLPENRTNYIGFRCVRTLQ